MQALNDYFSDHFSSVDQRKFSYNFIESFLSREVNSWVITVSTERVVKKFQSELKKLNRFQFAFLVCHSGYIPEKYLPDSSQETIYSKLIEAVVQEWAIRIGFSQTALPTQKSSKEDVTISDGKHIIVCDAKSFRLGRSQGAPNVKDVLKHADISKWLSVYPLDQRVGGLVTFPSQHDWKSGSDFYQYTTDHKLPTMCLYYEHMAFMLVAGIKSERILDVYSQYQAIFPKVILKTDSNREVYYTRILASLFGDVRQNFQEFWNLAGLISAEFALHTYDTLHSQIETTKREISEKYQRILDIEQMRRIAIEVEHAKETEDLAKQMERITRFRSVLPKYFE